MRDGPAHDHQAYTGSGLLSPCTRERKLRRRRNALHSCRYEVSQVSAKVGFMRSSAIGCCLPLYGCLCKVVIVTCNFFACVPLGRAFQPILSLATLESSEAVRAQSFRVNCLRSFPRQVGFAGTYQPPHTFLFFVSKFVLPSCKNYYCQV
jgi:hypothetical protein